MISIKKYICKKKVRVHKPLHTRFSFLRGSPQILVICKKCFDASPKKPNSARRKVAKAQIDKTKEFLFIYIPGQGPHNLSNYNRVLIRGGRVRDLPGIRYKAIRGAHDFKPYLERRTSRSKYGTPNQNKKI